MFNNPSSLLATGSPVTHYYLSSRFANHLDHIFVNHCVELCQQTSSKSSCINQVHNTLPIETRAEYLTYTSDCFSVFLRILFECVLFGGLGIVMTLKKCLEFFVIGKVLSHVAKLYIASLKNNLCCLFSKKGY